MGEDCCPALVDVDHLRKSQRRALTIVLAINTATFVMMVTAGILSRSSSVLSGALDNFGDALTYSLSLAAVGAAAASIARVAYLKGALILLAATVVAAQVVWRLLDPTVPVFETMGVAALLNLGANGLCLAILTPFKDQDVNMSSVWECSRNDVWEGFAVLAAAGAVLVVGAGWPDLLVAAFLVALFTRSGLRVLRDAGAAAAAARAPAGP